MRLRRRATVPAGTPKVLPSVTVQLPLYNERHVAERAVLAMGALDYPKELLEIQVLDDSTDETSAIVTQAVGRLRSRGIRASHLRRPERCGFKAGALAHGLEVARGELIAVFDADFVPSRNFLRRVVGEFDDPMVGMVQARWGHLNAGTSWLTRAQALQLDAHFTIEHGVRQSRGCFFNFNGTAGVWRRSAIESAGGWRAATLTEDLDLSYRAQLAGWRFVYRDDVEVQAELPVEIAAYRVQQQRWAQGGVQTAKLLLPQILRARLPAKVKREAVWHLGGHLAYPLLVLLAAAGLAVGLLGLQPLRYWILAVDGALLGFAAIALSIFYGVAASARHRAAWPRQLLLVPVIMVLGAGIALGQTAAVIRGALGRATPFRRTPKYRIETEHDSSWRRSGYRMVAARSAVVECCAGLAVLAMVVAAISQGDTPAIGMATLLGVGFITVGAGTLVQRRAVAGRSPAVEFGTSGERR